MFPDCEKSYTTKFNLKRHVNVVHLKKKKFYCEQCERFFASGQNLNEHMNIHSDSKPFACPECNKKFRQMSVLTVHRRNHFD